MFFHSFFSFFFFNDTATTEIYTLSLHDALPISLIFPARGTPASFNFSAGAPKETPAVAGCAGALATIDRKSTRLNSSHQIISYAVFCLKKKKNKSDRELNKVRTDI